MIVICTGGRNNEDKNLVWKVLDNLAPKGVIVGDCPTGIDLHVRDWCHDRKIIDPTFGYTVFEADWNQFGLSAGPKRNREMVIFGSKIRAILVAFKGGKGTADCVRNAKAIKMLVLEAK